MNRKWHNVELSQQKADEFLRNICVTITSSLKHLVQEILYTLKCLSIPMKWNHATYS